MTSLHPIVDPRHFQDIVDEAKRRIPQYCPEWTDHNVSDPGITLIELFAWMTDLIRYRLNAVPERQYRHFLQLIGVQPRLPHPAQTELTFWLSTAQRETKLIPQGTEVSTRQTGSEPAVTFATDADLQIRVPDLQQVVLGWADPASPSTPAYHSATHLLREERARIAVFQEQPRPDDAFYLGFRESLRSHVLRLQLQCETARGVNIMQDDPPLQWEYWDGDSWEALAVSAADLALLPLTDAERRQYGKRLDATGGLNTTGSVLLLMPRNAASRSLPVEGQQVEAFWIRCRADRRDRGQPFYDATPVINGVLAEAIGGQVSASHQSTQRNAELGRSDGTPGQTFMLPHAPVLPRRTGDPSPETLEVERHDGGFEQWQEVSSFAESGPADSHFVLDSSSGALQFGPVVPDAAGQEKHHGRVPPQGRLLRFTRYRTGGGQAGNVGRGSLVVPRTSTNLDYVQAIVNLEPATGGRDGETLEELMLRGPSLVRTRDVAITRSDFEDLVTANFPQVVRAGCRANGNGGVEVTLVPALAPADRPLAPLDLVPGYRQRQLQQEVAAFLQERAPVTVGVQVTLAGYQWVSVSARLVIRVDAGLAAYEAEIERDRVRQQAARRLFAYIHPASGGPQGSGWPFEAPLTAVEVREVLEATPKVRHASGVALRTVGWQNGARSIGPDAGVLTPPPGTVFCSDLHVLEVEAE